jgi:glyoxylase-like metal-dependent hydrolase (beta-lactamase superfamily II)
MRVGDLELLPLIDGELRARAAEIYPGRGEDDWQPHRRWITHDGMIELAIGCFLIRTGDRRVLVDAGLGTVRVEGFTGGRLLDELVSIGESVETVTDVVFTHLHFDHVGWATQKGAIVFPNATYRCHSADWEHFVTGEGALGGGRRKLEPLTDRLEHFDGLKTIAPGVDTLPTPGHTPGHTAIVVSSGTERAILLGDAAHCPVELEEAEWEGLGDVDPELARHTRIAMMRELEETGTPASAAHFPGLRFGRLLRGEDRARWVIG